MFIVMGATGNVGAAVADELLAHNEEVTILTRHPEDADAWTKKGAIVARADVNDIASLREAFRRGRRAFLLYPPADPSGNTDATERRSIANILAALAGSDLEKVVAASTYGAQPGEAIGDLSTLWEVEKGLQSQPIPAAINRGAYYMTNWLSFTETVRETGTLPSMFPVDTQMPMVAPADLGKAAATRLLGSVGDTGIRYFEGPKRYTPQDVANAFAMTLGREVRVDVAPRTTWEAAFEGAGFSPEAASAYARMTAVSLDSGFDKPASPSLGATDLHTFIAAAVASKA
ncbi:NmrA family NAD(P)-binding protein [Glacieibacterium frigidum]|uniref:NAD-dependent epimerase/dehydratase family protein n=1 Tax=Glacieibacterium frigidum TaxID=2593303 RepID=A0A552U9R2_9SPHN|nr:NmrA family NAD(P)-binding protein [Glacieibacterium frigidum]TRW14952.1 NAD-dependent epimerase/dehydratase family protein [Glacieibacterium frigidum]